jgi:hypothetical protein
MAATAQFRADPHKRVNVAMTADRAEEKVRHAGSRQRWCCGGGDLVSLIETDNPIESLQDGLGSLWIELLEPFQEQRGVGPNETGMKQHYPKVVNGIGQRTSTIPVASISDRNERILSHFAALAELFTGG